MESVHTRAAAIIVAALALMVAAVATSNNDWTRPLTQDKGTYGGRLDTPLDSTVVDDLRQRTDNYRNSGI